MAAQHGRSLHGKIILLNLLPIQLFKERDLHFQPDQSEKRKMGVKTQNKKTGKVYREKERGSGEEKKKNREKGSREKRRLQREYVKEERSMSGCNSGCSR